MKHKKNTKVSPTNSEKNASNVCQQLEISYENFQKTRFKPDSIEFIQLIRDFEVFLKEETNTKLLNYFCPTVIQNIVIHVCSNLFDADLFHQIFHLLNLIVSKTGVSFSALSYITLFLFLSNGDEERFEILKNERISIDIFSNELFFNDFISESLFNLTFHKLFLIVSSKEICQFYTNLIFKVSPLNLLSNYDYQPILDSFNQQKPNEEIFPEISVFLSGLFSINNKFKFYFNDKQNFEFLSELLFNAPFDTIIECFTYLIFIEPPNFSILKNIVDFYKKNLRIQGQFFDNGFKLIQLHPEIAIEINSIVPFSDWITSQTSISNLLYVIKLMNSIHISLVSQFLPSYFTLLSKENESIDYYIYGILIIESLIFHHQINLNFLLNSLFLKAFIVQPSIDILGEIFKKSNSFAQIVYDIYAIPEAESIRSEVLDKIIKVVMKNNEMIPIVSGFLAISGTSENLREIMKLIENSKNGNFCESLSFSFLKSDTLIRTFLREYGLKWIDSIFNQKIIDIQMVKKLLMSLTQHLAIQNIDDYIESLPKNHPLFSLEENDILSLIYGFESHPSYYPIKIYSLFHLIPCPTKIDPYNASIIGRKNVFKKSENLLSLPIIKEIGNRYITDALFYKLLKTPTQLEQFVDLSYDHFPLFQVFEYANEKVFDMKFNSISFWFRFESKIDDSLKVPFFHASKFSLFYKKDNLIAIYEENEYLIPINPVKWNHIFVSISPKVLSHQIKIRVNLNKFIFTSPTKLLELDDFGFLVYSTNLFIGPAIRIYDKKTKDAIKIFELGPSSLIKLNEDHLIVPSTDFLADTNILPVLYYGFSEHFKSEKKLKYFFEILKKTIDDFEFDKILSLYFKVYLLLKRSRIDLFSPLMNFFASNPEKLTKERFIKILDFFGNNQNKNLLLNNIIQNKLLWKNISNDLIVFSLISYFKTFDFCEDVDKFQYFLTSKIILNQKDKNMINLFLNYSKILPKCQKLLLIILQCHHYMYQRQNKTIQCDTKSPKNNNIKDEKQNNQINQYLLNKGDISIQCEIDNNNSNSTNFNEQLLMFQETELQFNIIECLYDFIKTENIESIKSILPMDDLINLFIVSQNDFKSSLFKIFVLIEEKSPGIFIVNNTFLAALFPLFIYQNVWDEVMSLVTNSDGKTVKNTPMISLLLALIWSLISVSLHSVSQTGKSFSLSFDKEIKFCISNFKIIAMNKITQQFIRNWFPLLLGFENNKSDNSNSTIKIENIELTPPKVSDFVHQIRKTIIQAARTIDKDLPLKTDKFYSKEFKRFIPNSDLIVFLIDVLIWSPKDQIIHIFSPILCIQLISGQEMVETFIIHLITSCLIILSQSYLIESLFVPISPVLHYMSSCGLLKSSTSIILTNLFSIIVLFHDLYPKSYKKALPTINNLMINIFANCDDETLPDLFNILLQNVQKFNEVVQSTNSLDIYLFFFQKVASKCYTEFDNFFKKFLDVSKIDQKNKKVNELLNHVEVQDNALMNKWNKILNSFNSITKIVKNENNNCFSSMMSELIMNSKEFSKIYWVFRKKQNEFSEFLKQKFHSTENIQNAQEYFNYSINNLYESAIQSFTISTQINEDNNKQKKLLPFSFPLFLPHLLVPTPIHSPKEVKEFIDENNLYSKEEKIREDSGKDTKNVSKKTNTRKYSQCQVDLQQVQAKIESANKDDSPNLNEKKKQLKRRQSMVPSSISPNLTLIPKVFNCQLRRCKYSIPIILSITSLHLDLIPTGSFDSEFISEFVMEVINGFWGMPTVSEGKIVIKIPLNSILAINQKNSKSVTFWTMNCGTFILDEIESDVFEKKPFSDMKLFTSQDCSENKNEVVQKWIDGSLSTSQMIVLLNYCEGKDYVDQNNFIEFPNNLTVFGTFSPINESLHSNLIEGIVSGIEKYSNSIELIENFNSIVDFIKKFDVKIQSENLNRPSPSFTINSQIFCQKISGLVPSYSLFDNNSIITKLPPLSSRISDTLPFYIVVDRNEASLYAIDLESNRKFFAYNNKDFSFARSISVSKSFTYFVIDMEDDSYLYEIVYQLKLPSKLEMVKKVSFLHDQVTAVNETDLIAATFSEKTVYIWPFYRYSYHRIIDFEKKIRFCQFDDNSGTFWVCDKYSCFLFDLNGKLLSTYKFEKRITAFTVVPQPVFECERSVICGFADGSICLVSPKIESAELFVKELKKCHQSKIEKITFNPQKTYFLSIDDCQNAFFWTKKNVDERGNEIDVGILESCPLCRNKPLIFCSSCKRYFCSECLKDSQICPECSNS